jgi:hypothetical protein
MAVSSIIYLVPKALKLEWQLKWLNITSSFAIFLELKGDIKSKGLCTVHAPL